MNRQATWRIRFASALVTSLASVGMGFGTALAASRSHEPSERCRAEDPFMCVDFRPGDRVAKTYPLQGSGSKTTSIVGAAEPAVWNTSAPVTLTASDANAKCTLSKPPMNVNNSRLMIGEDGGQYMYLISADRMLERRLDAAWRTDGGSRLVGWLEAESGNDDDPYDYFVEFEQADPKDAKKHYRVESFPHLDATAAPKAGTCDCERPDVMHPVTPGNGRPCERGATGMGQTSTGVGTEPGH